MAYDVPVCICSSGVIWEEKKRKRYRALKLKQSVVIEKAFELYEASLTADKQCKSRVHLEGKMEVKSVVSFYLSNCIRLSLHASTWSVFGRIPRFSRTLMFFVVV